MGRRWQRTDEDGGSDFDETVSGNRCNGVEEVREGSGDGLMMYNRREDHEECV